jgi:2-polyprenyl-3-methyl-5-hydroxy-6-metoxy-1,4-benzoquinol methylase
MTNDKCFALLDGTCKIRFMKYGVIATNPLELLALYFGKVPVTLLDSLYTILKARTLMAGVRLGIFEALKDEPGTAETLSRRLALDEECLELLLRNLTFSGYLERDGPSYRLSRLGRENLIRESPYGTSSYLLWNYVQWEMVDRLEELLQSGTGIDLHQTLDDAAAWETYQRGMFDLARKDASYLAAKVPVPRGATSLLDIGGGHGLLGAAICRKHPPLKSTVLDLPQAVQHASKLAREEGFDDVVGYREGDLLASDWGEGHDVVLLANILHHFQAEENQEILRKAASALHRGGTVAIWDIERSADETQVSIGDPAALFFRLMSNASVYRVDQYMGWATDAGFRRVRSIRSIRFPGFILVIGRTV